MLSQKERVLEHLMAGNTITPLEALNLFDCFRLSDVIFKLKADFLESGSPHRIDTEIIKNGRKRFARYKLIKNGRYQRTLGFSK